MEEERIIIIGAGAAGLSGAQRLSEAGHAVTILEARNRVGGRIHSIRTRVKGLPIELGAEFIHGTKNQTWPLVRAAKLKTRTIPDRHWLCHHGALVEQHDFWDLLTEVSEKINTEAHDEDFDSFLRHTPQIQPVARWLAREYVEGFHAAPTGRMSTHAFALADEAAEKEGGTSQFHLVEGYSALANWLKKEGEEREVELLLSHIVREVRWEQGRVEVECQTPAGGKRLCGKLLLITVPLGVLKTPNSITFEPALHDKDAAVQGLEMGMVLKVVFHLRSRIWPVANFGFVHSDDEWFPTWWADDSGPTLTGWTGGTRAEHLGKEDQETILEEASESARRIFGQSRSHFRDLVLGKFTHNWGADPFSSGAYSFTPVGMMDMPGRLSEPVENTLFFAGEATNTDGDQGTVHGALQTGHRAAKEMIRAAKQERRAAVHH